jgi:hypothetical protein
MLADDQIDRYSRQILLRDIGARGQERLLGSSVAIVGCGSLAHLCALYLAGAGIGHIRLLATEADPVGAVDALADDLSSLNPEVRVEALSGASYGAADSPADVLVDTGARPSTLAAAAATSSKGSILLAAGIRDSHGWLARHGSGICVGCVALHEATCPANLADGEPSATGVVASLLAFETLAAVLGWEENEGRGGWRHYDGTAMSLSNVRFTPHAECTVCDGAS